MLWKFRQRYDWFAGARRGWRVDAEGRLNLARVEHADAATDYIRKRLDMAPWGTFERRRWAYIRKVADRERRSSTPD